MGKLLKKKDKEKRTKLKSTVNKKKNLPEELDNDNVQLKKKTKKKKIRKRKFIEENGVVEGRITLRCNEKFIV